MAAIDLGQVKGDKGISVRNRGAWNSTAQYINNTEYIDVVSCNGSLWMCVTTNTNSAPSKTNEKWSIAAEGVASIANNLTTTAAGSALDARQGSIIKGKIDKIYSDKLLTMDEIDLVTEEGFFVDALAVKELNSNLYKAQSLVALSGTTYTPTREGFLYLWYKTDSGGQTFAYIKDLTANMIMTQAYVNGGNPVMINTPIITGHKYQIDYGMAGAHYFYFMPVSY